MENQNNRLFLEYSTVFSAQRLGAYLNSRGNNDKLNALAAYCWNVRLSQALYPALQVLEIALRNSLHTAICNTYKTEYWFNNSFLYTKEQSAINQAKFTLEKQKKPIEAHMGDIKPFTMVISDCLRSFRYVG